jgi:hypothetical protein
MPNNNIVRGINNTILEGPVYKTILEFTPGFLPYENQYLDTPIYFSLSIPFFINLLHHVRQLFGSRRDMPGLVLNFCQPRDPRH